MPVETLPDQNPTAVDERNSCFGQGTSSRSACMKHSRQPTACRTTEINNIDLRSNRPASVLPSQDVAVIIHTNLSLLRLCRWLADWHCRCAHHPNVGAGIGLETQIRVAKRDASEGPRGQHPQPRPVPVLLVKTSGFD